MGNKNESKNIMSEVKNAEITMKASERVKTKGQRREKERRNKVWRGRKGKVV